MAAVQYWRESPAAGSGTLAFVEMYSYTQAGLATKKKLRLTSVRGDGSGGTADVEAVYAYDNEGRRTSLNYPTVYRSGTSGAVPAHAYTFDSMGRMNGMTVGGVPYMSNVQFNVAGQVSSMTYFGSVVEARGYNANGQLTSIGGLVGITYNFSATQNDGRITSMVRSGETVTYAYDSINRLISAAGTGSATWSESYGYDGFGNLTSKAGASWGVNGATNRMTGVVYDGNGNQIPGSCYLSECDQVYDIENRIFGSTTRADGGAIGYDAGNKRVWDRRDTGGGNFEERLYFFGADGVRLGEYRLEYYKYQSTTALRVHRVRENYYFGSKLTYAVTDAGGEGVYADRLGSVVRRGSTNFKYRPYGDEYPSATGQDREKFGTYWRDGMTGLDYADQRYYAGSWGRFMSPDPSAPGVVDAPSSWNFYSYVDGDPVNFSDPSGLIRCGDIGVFSPGGSSLGSLSQVFRGQGNASALGRLLWNEQRRYSGPETGDEHGYMAQAIMNRVGLMAGTFAVQGRSGRGYWGNEDVSGTIDGVPHVIDRRGRQISYWIHSTTLFRANSGDFLDILHNASYWYDKKAKVGRYSIQPDGNFSPGTEVVANITLGRDIGDISRRNGANTHAFAAPGGGVIWLPDDCAAMFSAQQQSYLVYNGVISYNAPNFFPLGWNQSSKSAPVGDSHHLRRQGAHNFWGMRDWWIVP